MDPSKKAHSLQQQCERQGSDPLGAKNTSVEGMSEQLHFSHGVSQVSQLGSADPVSSISVDTAHIRQPKCCQGSDPDESHSSHGNREESVSRKRLHSESGSSHQERETPKTPSREQKYKRSTNNSHKKFISIARRWTFKNSVHELKAAFEEKFQEFKSTRTYFFILMAYIKSCMSKAKQEEFQIHFLSEIQKKIAEYEGEIFKTANQNLKSFRSDEITDLKFAIKAFDHYFVEGSLEMAIESVYKKDKETIIKQKHFEEALRTVTRVERQFQSGQAVEELIEKYKQTGKRTPKAKKSNQDVADPSTRPMSISSHSRQLGFLTPEMFGFERGLYDNSNPKNADSCRSLSSGNLNEKIPSTKDGQNQSQLQESAQNEGERVFKNSSNVILVTMSRRLSESRQVPGEGGFHPFRKDIESGEG